MTLWTCWRGRKRFALWRMGSGCCRLTVSARSGGIRSGCERLEDMVESIREHGVLNPVIVWQEGDGYEMLAGHNRQVAGRLAGLTEIPAIVKTDLTEEDAYVYVIETNVI